MIEHRLQPAQTQNARIDEGVVDDNIGVREGVQRQNRKQARVSRAGPDEPDMAGFKNREIKGCAVEQFVARNRKTAPRGHKVVIPDGFAKIGAWQDK